MTRALSSAASSTEAAPAIQRNSVPSEISPEVMRLIGRDATPEMAPVTMTATTITPRFRQKYPAVRLHDRPSAASTPVRSIMRTGEAIASLT